jgi:hypothetical protein
MLRLTLHIRCDRRPAILVVCVLAGILLAAAGSALVPAAGAEKSPSVVYTPAGPGRHFYLTNSSFTPDHALTACATGYHMASLWEILDVTNLTYDYRHPAAETKADSGQGPPSNWYGWVRTGFDSSGSSTTGQGNCLTWSSASGTNNGVAVRLSNDWETAPGDIFVWDATSFSCGMGGPVWCVRNVYTVYLPIALKAWVEPD